MLPRNGHAHGKACGPGRFRLLSAVFLAACLLVASTFLETPVWAEGIRIEPRITVSTTFTDNIDLNDGQKASGMAFHVSPGVSIHGEGRRTEVHVSYTGNFFHFTNRSSEEWRNNLQAKIKTEPITDYLHVDVHALMSQPVIDQRQEYSYSKYNRSSNRRQSQSYSVSPYLTFRARSFADIELRYDYRFVTVDNPRVIDENSYLIADYQNHTTQATISSGPYFSRFRWDLLGRYERIKRGLDRGDAEEVTLLADFEYRVRRWLGLIGSIGWDDVTDEDILRHKGGASC